MFGGTLVVSKAKKLYPDIKFHLEGMGYKNITITGLERDALITKIGELKPDLVLFDSGFNQAATPFIIGEILNIHTELNIAAVAVFDFPLSIASWFIWHGAKSCLHLWGDGLQEFKLGLKEVRKGHGYISPVVQSVLNLFPEWPNTDTKISKRQFECMLLLCCGLNAADIANELGVTRRTVDNTLYAAFDVFKIHSKEELVSRAWTSGLITKEDLKFFRSDKEMKLTEWAVTKQMVNEKLQKIYSSIHGGNYDNTD